jgi:PTH1 family peptidyl-tRNA hydrolase
MRDYYRVRLGIGRPPVWIDPADFVLQNFSAAERDQLAGVVARCADATQTLMRQGLAAAQNEFHPSAAS